MTDDTIHKKYGNPKAPLTKHLWRWKFFDAGATFEEWTKNLLSMAKYAEDLHKLGAKIEEK